ncbi:hypothetical protein BUE76_00020 [Cnuella takakiae]|nr:hypothetical protein BUE76_00020 [Cnuella takakiae]
MADLEKVSRADLTFQRNLIERQELTIQNFLENNPDLFFPEVILSYMVRHRFAKNDQEGFNPLQEIQRGERYRSNVDGISFSSRRIAYKNRNDRRTQTQTQVVTVEIDDRLLSTLIAAGIQPFLRIDGNHRLSAARAFAERQAIADLMTPFCLILLPNDAPIPKTARGKVPERRPTKFERTVFHNINSKSLPLEPEELYKVILDEPEYITDEQLKNSQNFGTEYLYSRQMLPLIRDGKLNGLEPLLSVAHNDDELSRTVLMHFFQLLSNKGCLPLENELKDSIFKTFRQVDAIYEQYPLLQRSNATGLMVAFLYFTHIQNKFNLNWFTSWILDNHLYELQMVSALDLVNIFEKMLQAKERTIFISMKFNDFMCESHYQAISDMLEDYNRETGAGIKLFPLRIDRYKDGTAYKIPDEILKQIEECGLLIADLTHNNVNVYHEVGYLMGLVKGREQSKLNLLLISNKTVTPINTVGFNINQHKTILFDNPMVLKSELRTEIQRFYFKN